MTSVAPIEEDHARASSVASFFIWLPPPPPEYPMSTTLRNRSHSNNTSHAVGVSWDEARRKETGALHYEREGQGHDDEAE